MDEDIHSVMLAARHEVVGKLQKTAARYRRKELALHAALVEHLLAPYATSRPHPGADKDGDRP